MHTVILYGYTEIEPIRCHENYRLLLVLLFYKRKKKHMNAFGNTFFPFCKTESQ